MKILYILSQKPGNTGSGVYIKYITREALKHNIELRIIVGIDREDDLSELSHINRRNIFPVIFKKDIPFNIAGMSDVMPYPSIRFSQFNDRMFELYCNGFKKVFKKSTKHWSPDIVHSNHLWIVTALAKEYFNHIPVITSCHGTSLRQRILAPEIDKKIKNNLKKLDKILALTETQKNSIVDWLQIQENQVVVTGSGYADDIFCLTCNKPIDKRYLKILYAGKISYSKGVLHLVKAFKNIPDYLQKQIKLFIAGDYNNAEGERIRNEIISEHISNIIFLGKLSQKELADKMREADIFILPSFFEGLPLVVLESLACGCVAIVTELSDIGQWIDENLVNEGVVKFIPLPKLKSIDEPDEAEVDIFVNNIKDAIIFYTKKFLNNEFPNREKIAKYINKHSFKELFYRILNIYDSLI